MTRVAALARAELLLLRRNPMALLVAAVLPVAAVALFRVSVPPELLPAGGVGSFVVTGLTGATLLLVVYYNLVAALVSRREELVLLRLRTGELSDAEIIAGTVLPAVAIAWSQVLLGIIAAAALFGLPRPANPVLAVVGLLGGTAVFVLLAAVSAGWTRTVALAEFTTTPVLVASMALSGLMFPAEQLPGPLAGVAQILPLTPVVTLLRLGLADGISAGAADSAWAIVVPLLVLTGWVAAGLLAARRWFRWEPRR